MAIICGNEVCCICIRAGGHYQQWMEINHSDILAYFGTSLADWWVMGTDNQLPLGLDKKHMRIEHLIGWLMGYGRYWQPASLGLDKKHMRIEHLIGWLMGYGRYWQPASLGLDKKQMRIEHLIGWLMSYGRYWQPASLGLDKKHMRIEHLIGWVMGYGRYWQPASLGLDKKHMRIEYLIGWLMGYGRYWQPASLGLDKKQMRIEHLIGWLMSYGRYWQPASLGLDKKHMRIEHTTAIVHQQLKPCSGMSNYRKAKRRRDVKDLIRRKEHSTREEAQDWRTLRTRCPDHTWGIGKLGKENSMLWPHMGNREAWEGELDALTTHGE